MLTYKGRVVSRHRVPNLEREGGFKTEGAHTDRKGGFKMEGCLIRCDFSTKGAHFKWRVRDRSIIYSAKGELRKCLYSVHLKELLTIHIYM